MLLSLSHSLLVVIVLVFFLPVGFVDPLTFSHSLSRFTFYFHDVFMCMNKKKLFFFARDALHTPMYFYAHLRTWAECHAEAKFDSLKWTLKRCC
jgi:hypothetical protein